MRSRNTSVSSSLHTNHAITEDEEAVLVSYIAWMPEHAFLLTRSLIKYLTLEILKESSRETLVNIEKGLSDNWWPRFKGCHPELTSQTPDSFDRSRALSATPEAIDRFFSLLENITERHGLHDKPQLIWKCDESGFGDKLTSKEKVVCQKGETTCLQAADDSTRAHYCAHGCQCSWSARPTRYASQRF